MSTRQQPASIGAASNIVQFPYSVSRRVHSRRTSKNGTPEQRAAREAALPSAAEFDADHETLPLAARQTINDMVVTALNKRGVFPSPPSNEIGRNEQLRRDRLHLWQKAEARFEYHRDLRALHFSIYRAKRRGVLHELDCPKNLLSLHGDFEQPWVLDNQMIELRHAADVDLLLTPAPTAAAVEWKRKKFASGRYTTTEMRHIEKAIDADAAFLAAHPARQSRANKRSRGSSGE